MTRLVDARPVIEIVSINRFETSNRPINVCDPINSLCVVNVAKIREIS